MAPPSSSRMMAGSEIPDGPCLMSLQLHVGDSVPIVFLFHGFYKWSSKVCPALHTPKTALTLISLRPS
ncbi:hypothetical protein I79_019014 [Cricetulus griseus]|uniref:Uncharacterized protein n=1 Tax=Cricetulus griseus TaxID=10029 RepID=G3I6A2_CRIGR|nr:hypothetical protein I79_019014 [Cricetulus griseus]